MKKLTLDWTLIILTGVAFTLAGIAWWKGGQDLALEGLRQGFQTFVSVTPMVATPSLFQRGSRSPSAAHTDPVDPSRAARKILERARGLDQ